MLAGLASDISQQVLRTDVAGMPVVYLVLGLVASDADLRRIHDYDVVSSIHVRRIFGFVLAAQSPRNFGCKPPQRSPIGVYHIPIVVHFVWLC